MGDLIERKISSTLFPIYFIVLLVAQRSALADGRPLRWRPEPCERLVLHFHDIFPQRKLTFPNTTSAIVTKRVVGLGKDDLFGEMHVFDSPMTIGESINSTQAARARGFYLYDRKDMYNTLFAITLDFNSSEYKGSLTILGNNDHQQKTRDLPILGGTGDFLMARGITTVELEEFNVETYLRLKMEIKLYECH